MKFYFKVTQCLIYLKNTSEHIFTNKHEFRVGKKGYVFLVKALMDIEALYADNSVETLNIADLWENIIRYRLELSAINNYEFRQIIIPEKISLANKLFYRDIAAKSPLMSRLETMLNKNPYLEKSYVSAYDTLLPHVYSTPSPIFPVDTHFTTFGTYKMLCSILHSLGMDMPIVNFPESKPYESDVGKMITGSPVFEDDLIPVFSGMTSEPELIEKYDAPDGGHFTTRRGWRCPSAPINRRVLVIGNSYFGLGLHSREMSWWGARLFTEFHFIWGHHFNYADVNRVNPDIVIGQTIERYLGTAPWA